MEDFIIEYLISTRKAKYCNRCDKTEDKCDCDCDACSFKRNQCVCLGGYLNKNIVDETLARLKNFVFLSDTPGDIPVDVMVDEIIEDIEIKIKCDEKGNEYEIKQIYTNGYHIGNFFVVDEQEMNDNQLLVSDSFEKIKNKATQFEKDAKILGLNQELKMYMILKT